MTSPEGSRVSFSNRLDWTSRGRKLLFFLLLLALLVTSGLINLVFHALFGSRVWISGSFHLAIEFGGALISLMLVPLILAQQEEGTVEQPYIWIASSLVARGILHLAHSFIPLGNFSNFTGALGTFAGGVLFSLVWLPPHFAQSKIAQRLPWIVGIVSILVALSFNFLSREMNRPAVEQSLRIETALLMGVSVIGNLAATVFFLRQNPDNQKFNLPKEAFTRYGLLLALSGSLFFFGERSWDAVWWAFHFGRLAAYLNLLHYLSLSLQGSLKAVLKSKQGLQEEVWRRTLQLTVVNKNMESEIQRRIQSQDETQRVQGQLEATLQAIQEIVLIFNMEGNLVFLNRAGMEVAKFLNADPIGKNTEYFSKVFSFFDMNGRRIPVNQTPILKPLQGEPVTVGFEARVRHQNSDREWYFDYSGQPVYDGQGKQILAVIVARDVTRQRKAEIRLKESEVQFRELAEFMPQIIWSTGVEGIPKYYNQRWFEYTGQKPLSDPKLMDWEASVHPEDVPKCYEVWKKSFQNRLPFQMEFRLRRWDGQYRWYLGRALYLPSSMEGGERWLGTSTDIHDQKMLLERVKESETNLRLATESAQIGTWRFDLRKNEIRFSDMGKKIFGLDPKVESFSATEFWDRVFPEDRERADLAIQSAIDNRTDYEVEYRIHQDDGGVRWIYSRGNTEYVGSGKATRLYGISMDITERKVIEERLKTALNQANEANRLKSAFLANMSHEIRTPLGAIIGFTDLLRDSQMEADTRNCYFEVIKRNGNQLLALINDILDLSKVEAGQIKVENIRTNFRDLLQEVISLLWVKAQEKNLQLNSFVESNVPELIGTDPVRLKQILTNIIGNAVKFTQEGFVYVHAFIGEDQKLHIQIQDSGPGLTEKEQEKIFQPFSQGDSSTTRKFGGTGLGLALSRKLARALQGDLKLLFSEPEGGCLFEITIANQILSGTVFLSDKPDRPEIRPGEEQSPSPKN